MGRIEHVAVTALEVPVDGEPESDGTLTWSTTGLVVVELGCDGATGLGWSYTHGPAAAAFLRDHLDEVLLGRDPHTLPALVAHLARRCRNVGRQGLVATALSAVDVALWDLRARLLDLPLARLFGTVRDRVPVYGSGGFTSYPLDRLQAQLAGWVDQGIGRVKMKVGRDPGADPARVRAAREAIGQAAELYVDANGAYHRKQALALAGRFADEGVSWFEEPVTSDDLEGLRLLRDRAPPGVRITAGEYAYGLHDLRRLLEAGAVDVLMADCTRCLGYSGLLDAAALCAAWSVPLSSHCAPALHLPVACAAPAIVHLEYFHDHVRIERTLFEGLPELVDGTLEPDWRRPGHGMSLRHDEARRFTA